MATSTDGESSLRQGRQHVDFTDIFELLEAADSECDEMSSEEEFDDCEEIGDLTAVMNEDIVEVNDENDDVSSNDSDDDIPLADLVASKQTKDYRFEGRRAFVPPHLPQFISEPEAPIPKERLPIEYVHMFLTDDMLENLLFESNKYGTEKNGTSPNITKTEIETFIGIYFMMGIVRMPNVEDYWSSATRYALIADRMSRNRFQTIHRTLHFVDNNQISEDDKSDRVWKLRPWIDKLRANFSVVSCEEHQSIDEIMVPFKGRSILKMYMPKKPKKRGFKLWGRASSQGFLHDFNVYQGKGTGLGTDETEGCGLGGNVVLQLTEALPKKPFKIFADNFFSNLAMVAELKKHGLQYTGAIVANRLHGAPLKSENELKKEGRGAYCSAYESNNNLSLVRWFDNKAVTLISTYLGVAPVSKVKRYNRSAKLHEDVDRPAIVGAYNSSMGGIDLFDMMCTLYKRQVKSKRWYLYIFYHSLTMIMVNSWFLYCREVFRYCQTYADERFSDQSSYFSDCPRKSKSRSSITWLTPTSEETQCEAQPAE